MREESRKGCSSSDKDGHSSSEPPFVPRVLGTADNRHRKGAVEAALWGQAALEEGGQDASFPSQLRHSSSSGMRFLLRFLITAFIGLHFCSYF